MSRKRMKTEDDLLFLTPDDIRDFQACELYYKLDSEEDMLDLKLPATAIMSANFSETMRKVIFYYLHRKQAGMLPSAESLTNRWERLWFPKDMDSYDIATEQRTRAASLRSYAVHAGLGLQKFHEDFEQEGVMPVLIDEDIHTSLAEDIRLETTVDTVLRLPGKRWMAVHFLATPAPVKYTEVQFRLAAMKHAMDLKGYDKKSIRYKVYNIAKKADDKWMAHFPQPTDEDVESLFYWAREIFSKDKFVPRRGFSSYCRGCKFDLPCQNWSEWLD